MKNVGTAAPTLTYRDVAERSNFVLKDGPWVPRPSLFGLDEACLCSLGWNSVGRCPKKIKTIRVFSFESTHSADAVSRLETFAHRIDKISIKVSISRLSNALPRLLSHSNIGSSQLVTPCLLEQQVNCNFLSACPTVPQATTHTALPSPFL